MQNLGRVQRTPTGAVKPMNAHDVGLHAAKQKMVHPMNTGMLAKHTSAMKTAVQAHTMGPAGSF